MIRRILIRILFRLLKPAGLGEYNDIDDKHIDQWLARNHSDRGFIDYIRKRDLTLLKTMGMIQPEKENLIYGGQRLEILTLMNDSYNAFKKLETERKNKQKELEKLKKGRLQKRKNKITK